MARNPAARVQVGYLHVKDKQTSQIICLGVFSSVGLFDSGSGTQGGMLHHYTTDEIVTSDNLVSISLIT